MNKLPKNWYVKQDEKNIAPVIEYLNKKYNFHYYNGNAFFDFAYGEIDNLHTCDSIDNLKKSNATLLSIEEFIELSKEVEEFVMPEKWYCLFENKEQFEIANKFFKASWAYVKKGGFTNRPNCNNYWATYDNDPKYTKITFEQFKQFVLKEKFMGTKEIIGFEILKTIWGFEGNKFTAGNFIDITNKESLPYFSELGILSDTSIFKPIHKEEKYPLNYSELESNEFYCCEYERQGVYVFQHNNKFWMNSRKEVNSHSDGEFKPTNGFHKFRKATKKEIEEILLLEAKKRYPIGTKFISSYDNKTKDEVKTTNFYWYYDNNIVVDSENGCSVYTNGIWAEILPSYPQITINGYKGEFYETYVKFGCAKIDYQQFIDINELFKDFNECYPLSNKGIEFVTIGKGTFSREQIKEIAEYYLQNK